MTIAKWLVAVGVGVCFILGALVGTWVAGYRVHPTQTVSATPTWTPRPSSTPKPTELPSISGSTSTSISEGTENGSEALVCRADKQYTAHELPGGPQRLEVTMGVNDKGHLDYYPAPGVKSVSVGVMPGESEILKGYGSLWLFPLRDCMEYDLLADMENYAQVRRGFGHSGLVWASLASWLQDEDPVVNLWGEDPEKYRPVFWSEEGTVAEAIEPSAVTEDCQEAIREDHMPVVNEAWSPCTGDVFRIINFWSNQPGADQSERKLLLEPGQDPSLFGGGSAWCWSPNCDEVVQREFAKNTFPSVTLDQLEREGLAR